MSLRAAESKGRATAVAAGSNNSASAHCLMAVEGREEEREGGQLHKGRAS